MPQRDVIANITLSMDGFAADPAGGMGWLVETALHEQTRAACEGLWRGAAPCCSAHQRRGLPGLLAAGRDRSRGPPARPRLRDLARRRSRARARNPRGGLRLFPKTCRPRPGGSRG